MPIIACALALTAWAACLNLVGCAAQTGTLELHDLMPIWAQKKD